MRVLHVLDHSIPLHSGYSFRSRAILDEQRKPGWETSHLTSPKHSLSGRESQALSSLEEEVDGLRFYRSKPITGAFDSLPVINQLAVMSKLQKRLSEVVAEEKPDLIQAHSPALNAIPAIRVGRRTGIPVVYEVRGFWEDAAVSHGSSKEQGVRYRLTRGLETHALRHADAVSCICEGIRGDIVARGIAEDKIIIVPNAVDIDRFEPVGARDAQLAAEFGLANKPVVGFIGSFYAYEGLDLLLDAVPRLQRALPDIQVVLVGGGPVEAELRAQVQRLGLSGCTHFTGRVPHDQVSRYYSLVDILVYARHSMRITELVTPLKPLEAMAQQCLFVASDVSGHKELIRDGETGILFRADDEEDLARSLVDLFTNRKRWPALRRAGRHFVEQERSWTKSISNYKPLYEKLMRNSRNRGESR